MYRQSRVKFGVIVPILAALLLVLALACGSSATSTTAAPAAQVPAATAVPEVAQVAEATAVPEVAMVEGAPKYGGTLVVAMVPDHKTLDPPISLTVWDLSVTQASYDNLLMMRTDLTRKPELATSWEANDDNSSYTMHLRKGVKFHHGKEFKAEDVIFTFDRLRDPVLDSPARSTYTTIEDVVAIDDYTVRFDLTSPNGFFLDSLSLFQARILPADVDISRLTLEEFGTGPFKILEHRVGERTVMVRNEDYWDVGKPYLDEIVFIAISEETVRVEALKSGDADVLFNLAPQNAAALEAHPDTVVLATSSPSWIGLPMRNDTPPFDNILVRKAVQAATNRESINQAALLGQGVLAFDHPIHPSDPRFAPQYAPPAYDTELARSLLEQAGYPDGIDLTLYTADVGSGVTDMAIAFKESAAPAGIRVDIVRKPADGFWDVVWNVEPFTVSYWRGRNADQALSLEYHSDSAWNTAKYYSDTVDELIEKARGLDLAGQQETYGEIQRILIEEVPRVVVAFQPWLYGARKDVRGVDPHPLGHRIVQDGWFDR